MAQMEAKDQMESLETNYDNKLVEMGSSSLISTSTTTTTTTTTTSSQWRSSSSFRNYGDDYEDDNGDDDRGDAYDQLKKQWAEIERLPTFEQLRSSLFDGDCDNTSENKNGKRVTDVTKLGAHERHRFIEKLIKHDIQSDNLRLLQKIRRRLERVGVKFPTVEVRFKNLHVEAECEVVHGKPLPTLWNATKSFLSDFAKLLGLRPPQVKITIINDVSGVIKPGRLTLLLGSPGCGKSTLLKALSGNLNKSFKVTGEVSYNGYKLEQFVPQKTSTYVSQYDLHTPEMTVRETLDFSSRCQGNGSEAEILLELIRREKEAKIIPDPDIDTYMKATSVKGLKQTLKTDYILKILGLDICADTLVGDAMRRGISGGQKKRLTTGEIIVGPVKALFLDEITNGLDMSTSFQIVTCLQHLAHVTDATVLVSLLQPSPETFNLFDDIILMAEGKILYHGPRECVVEFFEGCGFRCPERKAVADFLQEVMSRKDQAQYWSRDEHPDPNHYVSVDMFSMRFQESPLGKKLQRDLSEPYDKSESLKNALSFSVYSLSGWEELKACMSRELLLTKRNYFFYVFKTSQVIIMAIITMTVFLHSRMEIDVLHANYLMGSLFYALVIILVDGVPEMPMTLDRLSVFYKQKELCFYPAWAYAIPATILNLPLSLIESLVWTSLTYYTIGYSPELGRFSRQFILLFVLSITSSSMFRFLASVIRIVDISMTVGSFTILSVLLLGGFILPQPSMPAWLKWSYWVSPLTYGQIGISINEFLAPRWQKILPTNTTIGREILKSHGLNFDEYCFWISLGALLGFALLFNIGFALALSFLKSPGSSRAIISRRKLSNPQENEDHSTNPRPNTNKGSNEGKMILPFEPITLVFQDVKYYIDTSLEMRNWGLSHNKLQLLSDITGILRPGVLTVLMGISGAGKTTLLDVLAGRKTSGYFEGEIRVNGYPKVQETFVRVLGYCEQTDIHSPQITVEESVIFSACLRLSPQIDSKTKAEFVNEVLKTIELDGIKDSLVGIPGVSGLSTEQRKQLNIAVELVANPSIIFMDEPTTGLDARAAAIVMRAVKNVADTGRTIVCTIHQPSIDIFESFDELILLKDGGRIIYSGPLGNNSSKVIEYFESIPGVPRIKDNYNPATWILEVTSTSAEAELGIDFAQMYKDSILYKKNKELVKQLSKPIAGSKDLHFTTRFSQNGWGQFTTCLWKQNLSYWRSPSYNLMRIVLTITGSLLFGTLFWDQGQKINNEQNLFNIVGSLYTSVIFFGSINCSSALPYVASERTVMYRENSAGMYSHWAYALAQVTVEFPYILFQAVAFVSITYPMIGYYVSAYKIFWNFYGMLCTMLYFNYLGMMLVSLTPNVMIASVLFSTCYTTFNLFSGFLIAQPQIPKWWMWAYYLNPTSWSLKGMISSQYGDIDKEITVFLENKTVASFLAEYFGFRHDNLVTVAVVLVIFPLLFASLFAIFIAWLNFQRR